MNITRPENVTEDNRPRRAELIPDESEHTPEHIMQFFNYAHLPEVLRHVSAPFFELAKRLVRELPRNPERTVALRKLLEAKDAAVRARVAS